ISDRFKPTALASASAAASTAASTVTEIFSFAIPLILPFILPFVDQQELGLEAPYRRHVPFHYSTEDRLRRTRGSPNRNRSPKWNSPLLATRGASYFAGDGVVVTTTRDFSPPGQCGQPTAGRGARCRPEKEQRLTGCPARADCGARGAVT